MRSTITPLLAALFALAATAHVGAQTPQVIGGDVYDGGANATISGSSGRDAFVGGFNVVLDGSVAGDGHAAGFDVDVDGEIGSDLYAAGASVTIDATVGEDVTASGFSVRLRDGAEVAGNARLSGGTVRIEGPIAGSLLASGGSVRLDAPVTGDVRLAGAEITFGGDATIGGALTYAAPSRIDIPEGVIPADRVRFIEIDTMDGFGEWRDMVDEPMAMVWPSMLAVFLGFVLTLAFLLVIAAVFLAFMPAGVQRAREAATERPGLAVLAGFVALATLFGLVPVSAMTLVGLPFIPIVILFIVLAWTVAYLLGAFVLSFRLAAAFGFDPQTNPAKLVMLAVGLVALAIVNFVPVLGWLINLAVVLYGLGAIVLYVLGRTGWGGARTVAAGQGGNGAPPAEPVAM
ncbi:MULTISPECIES: hypothetical protein [unclassified Roseitalea]|uniref:hypothetical protein n=1 Tax=unclassified Roseitalea TaxID=2639107 RepID=UPI00273F4C5F|nr:MULTISPECIES: hypothetical protein [unclassified Roseitalea]